MPLTLERVKQFKSYDDVRKKLFSADEISQVDKEVNAEIKAMEALQEAISKEIVAYMAKEKIGFNEFTRRLGTSSRQTSRVLKGEANLTMATIAEVAAIIGKRPKLIFE